MISPLRRTLLAAARAAEHLPEIPDAQIEIVRALPRGTVAGPGELAERLRLSRSTVSNLLTAMEGNGLVERRPRPGNHRHVDVLATAKALDLFDRFDLASGELVARAAATLPAADRAALAAAASIWTIYLYNWCLRFTVISGNAVEDYIILELV
ncbi:MarR family winged helix-turn-helix transcriptional regulator, partial [Micromonospora orduensis]|uniref:MarR family winged helix-turn-helix transcriptional regulator n=1 Tax=Micromonospora orduensis TaxID=1420891 RepID=UPI0033FBCC21